MFLRIAFVLLLVATFLLGAGCTVFTISESKRFRNYIKKEIERIESEESN